MPGHKNRAINRRRYDEECARLGKRVASGIPAGGVGKGPAHPGDRPPGRIPRHGAASPRVYGPLADQLAAELLSARPDLDADEFSATVAAWAESEARALLIRAYADEHPEIDPDTGEPARFVGYADRIETRAAKLRRELGITPSSAATLAKTRAEAAITSVDLASLAAAGRQALDSRTIGSSLELEAGSDSAEDRDHDGPGDHHDEEVNR